jgi:hypothetical protein
MKNIKVGDAVAFHYPDSTVIMHAVELNGVVGLIDPIGVFNDLKNISEDLDKPNVEVNWTIPKGAKVEQSGAVEYVTI